MTVPGQTESAQASDGTQDHEAIVVGAGSAGLSAAAALQRRGFETIVLERSGAVGARWRSRYDELRLNSWRVMSNLQGYRMPRSSGRYPGRDDFVAYLDRYVAHQRLHVWFHTELARAERDGELWRLETSAQPMLARYVVIATGWDAVAVLPDWPGRESFVPELIHSADFHSAREYRDREVLVVGAGNSGIDIAGHLIAAGARVWVSMRTAPNIAQREILGLPGQPVALLADHLPARIADVNFSLVQRMLFGDLTRYGIPRARDGAYTNFYRRLRNPAIDDGFIAALKQGRTQVVAQVERLDGTEVVLAGGTRLRPDAVICATGYRRGLESLVGHLGVLRPNGVPFAYRGPPSIPPHRSCISPACGASSAARSAWARSTPGGSHEPLPATAYAWTRGNSAQQEQQEADRPRRSHDTAA